MSLFKLTPAPTRTHENQTVNQFPTLLGIQDNDERVYLNALNESLKNNNLDTLYYVFAGLEDGKMEIF